MGAPFALPLSNMDLLLIEDDAAFGDALRAGLALEGHRVDWQRCAADGDAALLARRHDALVLDLGLPDGNGRTLLQALRARGDVTPVIVISARGQLGDRISLLDAGADDYLVKPFDLGELVARLRAVRRRGAEAGVTAALEHGALRLDPTARRATWHGHPVELRDREFALLEVFLREPQRLFTRAQLEVLLYGGAAPVESNAVEVHLHHLRRKLARDVVLTQRGAGYRLGPPR